MLYAMQLPSLKFRSILVAAGVAASIFTAHAQTYDFVGYVDQSNSSAFNVGQSIDIKYHLQQPLTNELPGFPGFYFYVVDWASVKIDNIEYVQSGQTPIAPTFYNLDTGSNGVTSFQSDGFYHQLQTLDLVFTSTTHQVIDENGLLEAGVPLDAFDQAGGTLDDFTLGSGGVDGNGVPAGEATFKITSYDVLPPGPSPVPESSTYGLAAAGVLGALAILRRRRKT
jgi:MYXO-CTERM domain-containing protein